MTGLDHGPRSARLARLKLRADFLRAATGVRANGADVMLQAKPRDDMASGARLGFTVTKKMGNSPERNRIRRRLKAAIEQLPADAAHPHADYVLVARRGVLSRPFAALKADLEQVFEKASKAIAKSGHKSSAQNKDDNTVPREP